MSGFGISGLGSGIDWQLYIDSAIKAETDALARTIGRREVRNTAVLTAFSNVKGVMDQLNTSVKGFAFAQDFKDKTVSVSDSSVATGTATLSANAQSIDLFVETLATNEEQTITAETVDSVIHNGAETTVTINVRGEDKTVEIGSGTTLSDMATSINSANIGVTAIVYDSGDGTSDPARLVLVDDSLGEEAEGEDNIQFADASFFDLLDNLESGDVTKTRTAQNTEVLINGQTVVRENHTLSDVLPGVTLKLKNEHTSADNPDDPIKITIQEDTSGASSKMEDFVSRYNEVATMLKQALRFDPNGDPSANPTSGNSTLRSVMSRLQNAMTSTLELPDDTDIRSLSDLGVETIFSSEDSSENGLLEFDASKFKSALDSNYDDVIRFFEGFEEEGVEYSGFAEKLEGVMNSFLDSTNGSINTKIDSLNQELKDLSDQKQRKLERIAAKEERMTAKFARLESQMAKLNSQQSALESAIQSINLNNKAISNRKK